ncbi:MAG: RagB/SusD family nutrient uptake outer membrane protein [Bacteroidales bacterium]|nr:RagB/SusD family nutrient uptake outer membrane protein [Bacteroidales bacterium]
MKKLLYSAAVLALTFFMSGCSLEETPLSKFDEGEAYKSATLVYVNTVASLYNKLNSRFKGGDDNYNYMSEFTADVLFLPGRQGDWVDGGKHQNAFLHRWDPSTDYIRSLWNNSYSDIALCNSSLKKLEEIKELGSLDESVVDSYIAEVRGIRAFYYMWLVDFFGRIPIVTSPDAGIGDVKQASRTEGYNFVRDELCEIIPNLASAKSQDVNSEYYARVTKAVGYAMLARLAINAAVFTQDNWNQGQFTGGIAKVEPGVTKAGIDQKITVNGKTMNAWETVVYCQEQIKAEGYELAASFKDNFKNGNESSKENIFVEPMDDNVHRTSDTQVTRSLHYNHASTIGFSSWNGTAATVHALNVFNYKENANKDNLSASTFECDDPRFEISFFYGPCSVNGVTVKAGVSEDKYPEGIYIGYEARNDFSTDDYSDPWGLYLVKWAGVRIKKYEYDPTTSGQNYFNADRVIFRYADMLLLAAEAQYRLGKKAEALALVNQVRARVGVDALTDITIKDILDEKLREEIWETMGRRGDMVRFGTYTEADEDKYQGVKHAIVASDWVYDATGYTTVFPIPVSVISLNSNLTQNPGY